MARYSQFNYKALATVGLASLLINVCPNTGFSTQAQAQSDPNQGLPPGTVGGGSRGSGTCGVQVPLMAFMPETNVLSTLETQPTLWVYLPEASSFEVAELVVYDQAQTAIIDTTFSVANQSGLLKVDLAAIAQDQPLDSSQRYRWFLSLVCPDNRAADISVDGWITLTPLPSDLAAQMARTDDPIQQANLYIAAGMWSEAVTTLVNWYESSGIGVSQNDWDEVMETLSPVANPLNWTTAYRLPPESDLP